MSINRRPASLTSLEGRVDVGDRVGDVVQAGTALLEEAADGRVRPERPQQLDVPLADV